MKLGLRPTGAVSLREVLQTVHSDPRWWWACLVYGAAAATLVGLPLAAGLIIESYDNSKRGYPTPLPPWTDLSTRYLAGVFALLIDFAFFILPTLVAATTIFACGLGLVLISGTGEAILVVMAVVGSMLGLFVLLMFMLSVAPLGRLRFADEGRIEQALSSATLRWALNPATRLVFLRARLHSLPAYLPALLGLGLAVALVPLNVPGQWLALSGLGWATMAALVYAHLVSVQLYVAAEQAAQRRERGMSA